MTTTLRDTILRNLLASIAAMIRNATIAIINISRKAAGLALLPFEMVGDLISGGGTSAPQLPQPPEQQAETEFEQLRSRTVEMIAAAGGVTHWSEEAIYAYACASREDRKSMGLSDIEPHHKRWLLELDSCELDDIKWAGLRALIKHMGQKKMISGVPAPYVRNAKESADLLGSARNSLRHSHAYKLGLIDVDDEPASTGMSFA